MGAGPPRYTAFMSTASPPTPPITRQLVAVARDIKLSHTIFALPFALLATFLAAGLVQRLPSLGEFGLILLCMVLARTFAMAVNRWADAGIDAQNARTLGRALPSGRVQRSTVLAIAGLCAAGFIKACVLFWLVFDNLWPAALSIPVLLVLAGYSFTKRFTWVCHLVLGFALALSPVAAAIAIEPGYLAQPTVWLLSAMVLAWVAGFDILYALQDTDADRELGLYSIPSRLGVGPALWISRGLHLCAAAALSATALVSAQLGTLFASAAGAAVALLLLEHLLVAGGETKRLNMAFFTVNGVISLLLGAAGIIDIVSRA